MKVKTIGIFGLGVFGQSIAKNLAAFDVDVIAMDKDAKVVQSLEPFVTTAIIGDVTDIDSLKDYGIDSCDVGIVATGGNLEASILAIINLKQLGVPTIIAKAKNKTNMGIYKQLGATRVILPEKEMGYRIAKELMRNRIIDLIELDDQYAIVDFKVPSHWVGKSLIELDVRNQYHMNVIGYRQHEMAPLQLDKIALYQFKMSDIVVAIAKIEEIEKLDYANQL